MGYFVMDFYQLGNVAQTCRYIVIICNTDLFLISAQKTGKWDLFVITPSEISGIRTSMVCRAGRSNYDCLIEILSKISCFPEA